MSAFGKHGTRCDTCGKFSKNRTTGEYNQGWKLDKYGHLQKDITSTSEGGNTRTMTYRYKLSRIAVRREGKSAVGWIRFSFGYFSQLSINPETGKLEGMKR